MTIRQSYFCRAPFEKIELTSTGEAFLCCPGWVKKSVGNLEAQTLAEVWNGEAASSLRRSVMDGSFDQCSSTMCPHLQALDAGARQAPYSPIENRESPASQLGLKVRDGFVPSGPLAVNAAFDLTCNLSCPSCRKSLIVARPGTVEGQRADKAATRLIEALPRLRRLKLAGNGDPFASRAYWKVLTAVDRTLHPKLRVVLHTNGIMFNADRWKELHKAHGLIDIVEISVDAATAETYALNRRGGSFETLLERLEFISKLRHEISPETRLRKLLLSFVVQANNFQEMPAFVELGRKVKADTIIFSRLNDWGSFPEAVLSHRSIHRPDHPQHAEFLKVLTDPVFAENDVFLGNLNQFRPTVTVQGPVL